MTPPPITPSPHRFVLSKKPRSRSTTTVTAPSEPSPLHISSSIAALQQQQSNTTPRFSATPRFKIPSTPSESQVQVQLQSIKHAGTYAGPSTYSAFSTPKAKQKSRQKEEVIEDDEGEDVYGVVGEDGRVGGEHGDEERIVHDSIESVNWELGDEMDVDMDFLQSHPHLDIGAEHPPKPTNRYSDPRIHDSRRKRRRISIASFSSSASISNPIPTHNAALISNEDDNLDLNLPNSDPEDFEDLLARNPDVDEAPSPPSPAHLTTQRRHGPSTSTTVSSSKAPHFLLPSTPAPKSNSTSYDPTASTPATTNFTRHRFLPPPTPAPGENAAEEQLPDAFSPHRRGRKYVPGGLAGEVAGWLVDFGGSENAGQDQAGDERGKRERERIRVLEVGKGEGMLLVRGEKGDVRAGGEEVQLVLIGRGEIRPGSVVRAKGKGWDVELEGGVKWGVWVRWEIVG